jgi:hypothetical protein
MEAMKKGLFFLCVFSLAILFFAGQTATASPPGQDGEIEPQKVYASTREGSKCVDAYQRLEVWNVGAAGGEEYKFASLTSSFDGTEEHTMVFGPFSGGPNGYILYSDIYGETLEEYLDHQTRDDGDPVMDWVWYQFIDGVKVEQRLRYRNAGDPTIYEIVRCELTVDNPEAFYTTALQPPPDLDQDPIPWEDPVVDADPDNWEDPVVDADPDNWEDPNTDANPDAWDNPGSSDAGSNNVGKLIGGAAIIGLGSAAALTAGGAGVWAVRKLGKRKTKAPAHSQPKPFSGTSSASPANASSGGIYGSGTKDDPYRDAAAFKVNKDGSISNYPENANRPPQIFGKGTAADPYRDHSPGSVAAPPPSPATSKPATQKQPPQKKDPDKKKNEKKKEQPKTYYLMANTNQIRISGGGSQNFQVEAWESVAGGQPVPCSASLEIIVPPKSGLTVSPASGLGRILATLSAGRAVRAGTYTLQIRGTAPDGQQIKPGSIGVTASANYYELRCNPQDFELRPAEEKEFELSLWRFLPDGRQETAQDVPVTLEPFGEDNPLEVDPLNGNGQFKCQVSVPKETLTKTYYLQASASPPDQTDELKILITIRVTPPPTLVVIFDKPMWEPSCRIDLFKLKDIEPDELERLAMEGGQLTVRAWGEFRGTEQIIESHLPIEDGTCRLERDGDVSEKVSWNSSVSGYLIEVAPLPGNTAGAHQLTVHVPVPVDKVYVKTLDNILKNARLVGDALGHSMSDNAEDYIQEYMAYIAKTEAQTLRDRKKELPRWLYYTSAFTRYSAESIAAFNLALNLHESAYRRFLHSMINAILEFLFWLIEKVATKAWRAFVTGGKDAAKETLEAQARQKIEDLLETEARTLTKKNQALEQQFKAATQETSESQMLKKIEKNALDQAEVEIQRIERELAEARNRLQTFQSGQDEAAQQAVRQEVETIKQLEERLSQGALNRQNITATIDTLEKEIHSKVLELQKLTSQLQGVKTQVSTLEKMQKGVRSGKNLKEVSDAITNAKPGPDVLDPQLKRSLDAFVDQHWKQLDEVLLYLEKNRQHLENADNLIHQVQALKIALRKELGYETIKMTQEDFIIKPELQKQIEEMNAATTRARSTMPSAYRALDRSAYDPGLLGWVYHKMDEELEWFYQLHGYARDWLAGFALEEDLILFILETTMKILLKVSNLLIAYFHKPEAVRSMIQPDLRRTGIDKVKTLGVRDQFFRFPENELIALGHALHPRSISPAYDKARMMHDMITKAENGYKKERLLQKNEALDYLENTLIQALTHDFEKTPNADALGVSSSMIENLRKITASMDEYVRGFKAAEASGEEGLMAVWERRMHATEWTAQDVETMIEWMIWAVQSLAILLGLMGFLTGFGAPVGAALLSTAALMSLFGAGLRVAIVILFTMPNIVGFQYDVIVSHALMYDVLYDGLPETLDNIIVERYDAGS